MKFLEDVALLGTNNSRTRAYLSILRGAGYSPSSCIFIKSPDTSKSSYFLTNLFDNETDARCQAENNGCQVEVLHTNEINHPEVFSKITSLTQNIIIFSGPSGSLLNAKYFSIKKNFIHVHPGLLPYFKGSTTLYYSLLETQKIHVTAFFLNSQLDSGPIIRSEEVCLPSDIKTIDTEFDPFIRASLLLKIIKEYTKKNSMESKSQPKSNDKPYYIIHPVLKHIATLSNEVRKNS